MREYLIKWKSWDTISLGEFEHLRGVLLKATTLEEALIQLKELILNMHESSMNDEYNLYFEISELRSNTKQLVKLFIEGHGKETKIAWSVDEIKWL